MDKNWLVYIVILIIIGLALGIGFSIYTNNKNETDRMDVLSEKELANNSNTRETIYQNDLVQNDNVIETSSYEEKISPNAMIVKKTYYEACDHLIRKNEDIPKELVNKTEADVEAMFPNWKIEEFSPTQITLYKTSSNNCGEHYFVQEHNGVIGIYITDQYGVKKLKEDTEISTQYLPEEDFQNLKAGVEIIGRTKLVEYLEDYE